MGKNINTKMQKRVIYQPTGLEMRETEGKAPMIHGVAIVADVEAVLYEGRTYREIESVAPSCISHEFIATQDIKLNLLHERELSFGRNREGKGLLAFDFSKPNELGFSHPVDSDIAQRAQALISNGTYTGCSFEFIPKDYEVYERKAADGKTEYIIRHTSFDNIRAVTIGMDPAYEQTSVSVRELYRELHSDESQEELFGSKTQEEVREFELQSKIKKKTQERALCELENEFFDIMNNIY